MKYTSENMICFRGKLQGINPSTRNLRENNRGERRIPSKYKIKKHYLLKNAII